MLIRTSRVVPNNVLSHRFEAGGLDTNNQLQLNLERRCGLARIVITIFDIERLTTLFGDRLSRTRLDSWEALRSELLQLRESDKKNGIKLPRVYFHN